LGKDPFIQDFSKRQQTILLSAFAQAVRERRFTQIPGNALVGQTVKTAVDNVSQTFRDHNKSDPRQDRDGLTSRILQQQFKGYKNEDPNPKQEKALPLSILRYLANQASTPLEEALVTLLIGAIFFCMRSCEYLKVPGAKDKKTKLLCLRNFRFFLNNQELDLQSDLLQNADLVSITFEDQKNGQKFDTVNLQTSKDKLLNPVVAWAKTTRRIMNYPGTSRNTSINFYLIEKSPYFFTDKIVIQTLRLAVKKIGEDSLGFKANEIGTHSIRSGGAMAMYLATPQIQTYTIQLIGRWLSDAFLKYIRKQVKQFSAHISDSMISNENFSHVPEYSSSPKTKSRMVESPKAKK
jgi:hypothetical protein